MRPGLIVALALLLQAKVTRSQDVDRDPFDGHWARNHLVPVEPHPGPFDRRFADVMAELLKVPEGPEAAVMVFKPSFEPEECLVLHRADDGTPAYTLIHSCADQNIHQSVSRSFRKAEGRERPVHVTRRQAELPRATAERSCRVWERMLREVRYPRKGEGELGFDGEIIEFRRWDMYGETCSPDLGPPKLLLDLGRSLIDYTSAPEANRPAILRDVEARCEALERRLDGKGE